MNSVLKYVKKIGEFLNHREQRKKYEELKGWTFDIFYTKKNVKKKSQYQYNKFLIYSFFLLFSYHLLKFDLIEQKHLKIGVCTFVLSEKITQI